jgi:hypothetical protein
MARIFSFRRPRASAIKLAIKRCQRQHSEQVPMLTCMQQYLIFRGDIEVHASPEHEYASDITGGDLA